MGVSSHGRKGLSDHIPFSPLWFARRDLTERLLQHLRVQASTDYFFPYKDLALGLFRQGTDHTHRAMARNEPHGTTHRALPPKEPTTRASHQDQVRHYT